MKINGKTLQSRGWPPGPAMGAALKAARAAGISGMEAMEILTRLDAVRAEPETHVRDTLFGALAAELLAPRAKPATAISDTPVPFRVWGARDLDAATLEQMHNACRLPVAVAGAQMPDGHVGYGLPIGGVLALRDAVIPYGVGVDIACRMKLSIMREEASEIPRWRGRLAKSLRSETEFGVGAEFRGSRRREHAVMDDPAWNDLPKALRKLRDKAWAQLGTSGSGNHFAEWGELLLERDDLGLPAGTCIALLSHSGSRGFGSSVAKHFTDIAMEITPLPGQFRHLAWLSLKSSAGGEYWAAMELAGRYAAANHDLIHRHVLRAAGLEPAVQIENHHNFAWIEEHNGERLVVHRKGATPAGAGVLGVIPGSMADPGFVVRGRGNPDSLASAAHGAGRRMSRKAAKATLTRGDMRHYLEKQGVELIAAGLDESPQAYKPILEVMAAQADLVEPVARFMPRIVLMADDGTSED
jgi:tRNA-splicing ligase RtcB (3'-phosphate/5'-hydroxy nucleic acid ligase)